MATIKYASPIGDILVSADNGYITKLYFADGRTTPVAVKEAKLGVFDCEADAKVLETVAKELDAYFAGDLKDFTVPIMLVGTEFRKTVWAALQRIAYGQTISYKELAKRINSPSAIRAVGGANHNNPISIIIPCHRVIGANGKLVGYGGGLDAKEFLLKHEKMYQL